MDSEPPPKLNLKPKRVGDLSESDPHASSGNKRWRIPRIFVWAALLGIAAFFVWKSDLDWSVAQGRIADFFGKATDSVGELGRDFKESLDPDSDLKPLRLPVNGMQHTLFSGSGLAPLKIHNRSESLHAIVKIEDYESAQPVAKYFVRAGDSIEKRLPEGRFRFKFASGENWYGEPALFGRSTNAVTMNKPLVVTRGKDFYFINHSEVEINIDLPIWSPDRRHSEAMRNNDW